MADISDVRLEALLRATLREEEAALPVTLRPEAILRRRSVVRRERLRRSGVRLLLVAAALLVPVGGLVAINGRPTTAPAEATYRAVILRVAAPEPGAGLTSDVKVYLAGADGSTETVAAIPVSRFPAGTNPMDDGWVTDSGSLGVGYSDGSTGGYATFDLHELDAAPVISRLDPRPLPDALPIVRDRTSPEYGELRVCRFTGLEYRRPCQGRIDRAIESGSGENGDLRAWLRRVPDVWYAGAAWAADGGIWALRDDRRNGQRAVSFVHVSPDGTETSGASFGIATEREVFLLGPAPDDSLAAVVLMDDPATILVDPRTGAATWVSGTIAGFASATDAAALPRAPGPIEPPEALPVAVTPAYRELEPLDDQLAPLPSGPVLLVHDDASEGPPVDYGTGPVAYRDGWVLSIECAGSGHLHAEIFDVAETDAFGGGSTETDCVYPGGGSFGGPSSELPADQPHQISGTVHTEGQVTWRLVVVEVPLASPVP